MRLILKQSPLIILYHFTIKKTQVQHHRIIESRQPQQCLSDCPSNGDLLEPFPAGERAILLLIKGIATDQNTDIVVKYSVVE